jgi:multidrug transporter EmrE-like cation transporter
MNIASFGLIITGVLLNAIAQLALKASVREMGEIKLSLTGAWPVTQQLMLEPSLWLGLFCYGISVIIWILALSRVDVTIAYPMLSIGYIVNALFAWFLFGEALTLERLTGIGVIIIGVYILARS